MEYTRGLRDLKMWRKAMDAAMRVFDPAKHFPNKEFYARTDAIRRAPPSVPANIAEA